MVPVAWIKEFVTNMKLFIVNFARYAQYIDVYLWIVFCTTLTSSSYSRNRKYTESQKKRYTIVYCIILWNTITRPFLYFVKVLHDVFEDKC